MGSDDSIDKPVESPRVDTDRRRKQAVGGVIVAVAAAAWFAFGKQILARRRLQSMETFILKADNGVEAHIRPLGCCIQSAYLKLGSYDVAVRLCPDSAGRRMQSY